MAGSPGNSRTEGGGLRWAGVLVLASALAAGAWLMWREDAPARKEAAEEVSGTDSPARPGDGGGAVKEPAGGGADRRFPRPDIAGLTGSHESEPDAEEWDRLLRLLKKELPDPPAEEDREISEAVMARFSAHAGARQVDDLAAVFRNASSMEVGQRALEVLGTLQSADFQGRAREIIADATLPADDQVVTALARSLAGSGTPQDVGMILDRIDTGKARDFTEYNGMDGLMAAVGQAMDPEMETVLCDALADKNGTRTWTARLAAAAALQNHSTPRSTQELSQAAANDADERVRTQARESLEVLRAVE